MDTDVVEEYKLADETEETGTSFLLFLLLYCYLPPSHRPPWSGSPCGEPKSRAAMTYPLPQNQDSWISSETPCSPELYSVNSGTNPLIASTFHVSITVQKSNWVEKSKIFFFFLAWGR